MLDFSFELPSLREDFLLDPRSDLGLFASEICLSVIETVEVVVVVVEVVVIESAVVVASVFAVEVEVEEVEVVTVVIVEVAAVVIVFSSLY